MGTWKGAGTGSWKLEAGRIKMEGWQRQLSGTRRAGANPKGLDPYTPAWARHLRQTEFRRLDWEIRNAMWDVYQYLTAPVELMHNFDNRQMTLG